MFKWQITVTVWAPKKVSHYAPYQSRAVAEKELGKKGWVRPHRDHASVFESDESGARLKPCFALTTSSGSQMFATIQPAPRFNSPSRLPRKKK